MNKDKNDNPGAALTSNAPELATGHFGQFNNTSGNLLVKDFDMDSNTHNSLTIQTHNTLKKLTPLQQRIYQDMLNIHEQWDRPVIFLDFPDIDYDTLRYEFRVLARMGVVEYAYGKRTVPAYYKIKGIHLSLDLLTNTHRVGKGKGVRVSQPIMDIINAFEYGPERLHNMRFRFHARGLHAQLVDRHLGKVFNTNMISLGPYTYEQYRDYELTCSSKDNCQVIIGCSIAPIRLDSFDIFTIPALLSQLRGQLLSLTDNSVKIPTWDKWTCIYQEVGRDSTKIYDGEYFNIQASELIGAYHHFYSKTDWPDSKVRLRKERSEMPEKPAKEVLVQFNKASELMEVSN